MVVLLHAGRIPAHIGLMINGNYNSLTIKERELNIKAELILKTIKQRSVEAVFFKIINHPVFSEDYQLQVFQEQMQQYTSVKANKATCLSPIKQFFEEFYAIKQNKERLLFDFLEDLNDNDYIVDCKAVNVINEVPERLHECDISKRSAIFFGTENEGLSEEVMAQADGFIKIPMVGFTDSLNISVSAAIIIQVITTRLRQSNINWKLSEEELLYYRLQWTKNSIKDIDFIEKRYYNKV